MVPVSKLSTARLRTEVQRVLGDQRYRDNAKKLQQAIRSRDPISMAAELIESALKTKGSPAGLGGRGDRETLRL
jgi:UDP:flavonoid glycosyltransferase YjiC (YdhE family)